MSETIHYEKPQIQEAIISIRLNLPEELDVTQLDHYYDQVKDRLPQKNYARSMQFKFDANESSSTDEPRVAGILLKSADGTRALQLKQDAFVFSYLNQYTHWEEFLGEATSYLPLIFETFKPSKVGPAGTRFINNIPVPNASYRDSSYFDTKISFLNKDEYPSEYLIQYVEELGDVVCNVVQTRNSEHNQAAMINVILDIDAMSTREIDFEEALNPNSKPWQRLREVKNQIFNSTLSEKAKEGLRG